MPNERERQEIEALLNARDAAAARRRRPHRLPAHAYRTISVPWCLTLCARHHGTPFAAPAIADAIVNALRFYRDRGDCRVFAFCLMPDHLHVVLALRDPAEVPPNANEVPQGVMSLVAAFKGFTTSQIAWKHGLHGRLWQRDFYDHAARDPRDFGEQCQYIVNNPVRKGLVGDAQEYRWSGLWDRADE